MKGVRVRKAHGKSGIEDKMTLDYTIPKAPL